MWSVLSRLARGLRIHLRAPLSETAQWMCAMSKDITGQSPEKIKIGTVAKHFDISVDLLRLYEREGLLLPMKSIKGTRYFSAADFQWISTLLHMVRESGLNFAGIRHLLALLPCWNLNRCDDSKLGNCPNKLSASTPCWAGETCCHEERDCYNCAVYRMAPGCANLKVLLTPGRAAAD
jgi:MerR family transcriptional regulator, heat shock protein HspR